MPRIPLLRCALLTALSGGLMAADVVLHYWNGDQRVDVQLAVDELVVEDAAGRRSVPVAADGALVGMTAEAKRLRQDPAVRAVRAVLYQHGARTAATRLVATDRLSLRVRPGQDLAALQARHGLDLVEHVPYSPDTVIVAVRDRDPLAAITIANRLVEEDGVVFATPLLERQLQRRGDPDDPQYAQQWHLKNTDQLGAGTAGNDLNVSGVWNFTAGTGLGAGVNIGIVDDGLETTHADLSGNARTDIDTDINSNDNDPNPGAGNTADRHGTSVGGVAAARGNNANGTTGVAPRAGLVGIRLIAAPATDAQEAQAINHRVSEAVDANRIHVSNNSWGPSDDGATLGAPGPLVRAALENGVTVGRGGRGVVYCWAGGNGRLGGADVSNYDGYANSRYVIAVGATRHDGKQASYSESGTNILVNAPGGGVEVGRADDDGPNLGIVATDRTGSAGFSNGDFTSAANGLGGTSFSTPAIAGVVALMLEANPALTWRDVRHALVRTATRNDPGDGGWFANGAGRQFNLKYGFGRANAAAVVAAVAPASWVPVPAEATVLTASEAVAVAVPDNNTTGVTRTRTITAPADFRIEYVEVVVSAVHTWRGDLRFRLTSPSGTVSDFQRRPGDDGSSYNNWAFTSVAHWGELNPSGTWTLRVSDEVQNDTGSLTGWTLRLYGYRAHPTSTFTAVAPLAIATGSGNTSITITGSGFIAGVTRVTSGATTLAYTVDNPNQITATVPSALLAAHGALPISVVTPAFDGPAVTSATRVIQVGSLPQLVSIPGHQAMTEDTATAALPISITDADGDTLTLSASSNDPSRIGPSSFAFGGSGGSRTLVITPVPDATGGPVTITLSLSDGYSTVTQSFTATIAGADDPPIAYGGRFRVQPGLLLSDTVGGYDPDGTAVTFSATDPPGDAQASFTFNTSTGGFTFTSEAGFRGMTSFTYQVHSGGLQSDSTPVFITVAGDPSGVRPLIVSEPADEQIAVSAAFPYQVVVDTRRYTLAPTLAYELVGAPAGMTIGSTGAVAWTASGADRHLAFGIVVKDTVSGAIDTQTVVLRVVAGGASN